MKSKISPQYIEMDEMKEGGQGTDEGFEAFRADVKRRIELFQDSKGSDETSEFNSTEEIPAGALFLRQANCCDKCYLYTGVTASIIFGAGMPAFSIVFGGMVDGLGEQSSGDMSMFKTQAFIMLGLGGVMWLFSWVQVTFFA